MTSLLLLSRALILLTAFQLPQQAQEAERGVHNANKAQGANMAAKIAAACDAAGKGGVVVVQPDDPAGDPPAFKQGCTVIDYRYGGLRQMDSDGSHVFVTFSTATPLAPSQHGFVEFYSILRPAAQNAPGSPPLGHDAALHARGPADIRLRNEVQTTAGHPRLEPGKGALLTVDSTAGFWDQAPLTIDRLKGDEEVIGSGKFQIVDGRHIKADITKAHSDGYSVDQRGVLFVDTPAIIMRADDGATQLFRIAETATAKGENKSIQIQGSPGRLLLAVNNGDQVPQWYGKGGAGLNIYASDSAAGTAGNIYLKNNRFDDQPVFKVDATLFHASVMGSAHTHARLFFEDHLSGGRQYSINNGSGGKGVFDIADETSGVRILQYDPVNKLQFNENVLVAAKKTLSLGGGTPIAGHFSAVSNVAFERWNGNDCQDKAVAVKGAADGDSVSLGVPASLGSLPGVQFSAFVSGAGQVTVRGCKASAGASAGAANAAIRVDVWQH